MKILYAVNTLKRCCNLLLLLSLFACNPPHKELLQALQTVDEHVLPTGHYVIIPNQGCEGCISTAEDFVKRHYTSARDVKYIFTRVQSLKLLRIKLGSEVMSSSKVLVDSGNVIRYPEKEKDIYPMIVTIKDGAIKGIRYQRPEEDGLGILLEGESFLHTVARPTQQQ
ncbi:hypothetical protein [uncultured Chitinophaga sp.]|jgi:hypothetical protein|uniref:hypothetical protein n=1 Tax=uncultured Chitinophaga sp. TaxID=339340 RepID=UPI00260E7927|nr:hypothetical protein [uncultured Chitinophaga sp.]